MFKKGYWYKWKNIDKKTWWWQCTKIDRNGEEGFFDNHWAIWDEEMLQESKTTINPVLKLKLRMILNDL